MPRVAGREGMSPFRPLLHLAAPSLWAGDVRGVAEPTIQDLQFIARFALVAAGNQVGRTRLSYSRTRHTRFALR